LEDIIGTLTSAHYEELYANHPAGVILKGLEDELDAVHDAVWLATSPAALQELWCSYTTRLNLAVSPVEKLAAAVQ